MRQFRGNAICIGSAGKRGIDTMVEENVQLCLEAADGSATKQYRIDNGKAEVRTLHSHNGYDPPESGWHRLTPQQLSTHVERNTVVAQWLEPASAGGACFRHVSVKKRTIGQLQKTSSISTLPDPLHNGSRAGSEWRTRLSTVIRTQPFPLPS